MKRFEVRIQNIAAIAILMLLFVPAVWSDLSSAGPKKSARSHKVDFNFVKNQIVLSVFIKGRGPFNMLLDTGVVPSAIDLKLAEELSLPLERENAGNAAGRGNDKIEVIPTKIKDLKINRKKYGDIEAVALNLEHLGKHLGMKLHGILGYSLLKDKIMRIDYQNKTVEFFGSRKDLDKKIRGSAYREKFTFEDSDIIPVVRGVRINDQNFIASIDTGSSLNVEIYSHQLDRLKLGNILDENKKGATIVGGRGKEEVFHSKVGLIRFGPNEFADQEVTISSVKNKDQTRMGNIGNQFLKNFVFSIDYPGREIILEKAEMSAN